MKLGDFISLNREKVDALPDEHYSQVTIRLYGRGAVERGRVLGSELGASKYVARAGQLIVSRIDARNGALDIVPDELDGALVSADFLTYDVSDELLPQYLAQVIRSDDFVAACAAASEGSTNRVRLQEERFLQIPLSVPDTEHQKRIAGIATHLDSYTSNVVRHLDAIPSGDALYQRSIEAILDGSSGTLVGSTEKMLQRLAQIHQNSELSRSRHNRATPGRVAEDLQGTGLPRGWRWAPLGSVCTAIVDCVNDTPEFLDMPSDFIGVKTTNVRQNRLVFDRRWFVRESDFAAWNRRLAPEAGDVILTREAPMGMAAVVPMGLKLCLTQRLVLLRVDRDLMDSQFLAHMLNDARVQAQIVRLGRSTPPHLRMQDIPEIRVPVCPTEQQADAVPRLDACYDAAHRIADLITRQRKEVSSVMRITRGQAYTTRES